MSIRPGLAWGRAWRSRNGCGDAHGHRVDDLLLLPGRVGVVEVEGCGAPELLGDAKVEADRLRVADGEVPFGSGGRRVTTVDWRTPRRSGGHDLADENGTLRGR